MSSAFSYRLLTLFLGFLTILGVAGISAIIWDTAHSHYAQAPELSWTYPFVALALTCVPLPLIGWVVYSVWSFIRRGKRPHIKNLHRYLHVSGILWRIQAVALFLAPLCVFVLTNNGNPALVICWLIGTAFSSFLSLVFHTIRTTVVDQQ